MSLTLSSSDPLARKDHRCDECSRVIRVGERYHRSEGPDDYGWATWKVCDGCWNLVRDLWTVGERGVNEYGMECYAYLFDVDWQDFRDDPLWSAREAAWRRKWTADDGSPIAYPEAAAPAEGTET